MRWNPKRRNKTEQTPEGDTDTQVETISFILHKKGCKLEFPFKSGGNKNCI